APPLDSAGWHPGWAWCDTLRQLIARLNPPDAARASWFAVLRDAPNQQLEIWANGLLAGDLQQIDAAVTPFVAAALQMHWTLAASRLQSGTIGPSNPFYLCPVCGFLPVAGVLQTGGAVQGLRYLVCGLCASQWHRPRIHC